MGNPLRPKRLAEFVGQRAAVRRLAVAVEAAKRRGEPLSHLLMYGPPGLGKTTLAAIAAEEMGAVAVLTSGPALRKVAEVIGVLVDLTPKSVLFIDEVHRLPRVVEEALYPAMEDGVAHGSCQLDGVRQAFTLEVAPFTLAAATTRPGALSKPLRDRFPLVLHLELYGPGDLRRVVERSAGILGVELSAPAAGEIARRARGTPRVANHLLLRVRDHAGGRRVTLALARAALDAEGVDPRGLVEGDWRYLDALLGPFNGGPAGVGAVAATLGEDAETIEEVTEPYLLNLGLITRTPRGRVATPAAREAVESRAAHRERGARGRH